MAKMIHLVRFNKKNVTVILKKRPSQKFERAFYYLKQ
jgi:hypothetical protein